MDIARQKRDGHPHHRILQVSRSAPIIPSIAVAPLVVREREEVVQGLVHSPKDDEPGIVTRDGQYQVSRCVIDCQAPCAPGFHTLKDQAVIELLDPIDLCRLSSTLLVEQESMTFALKSIRTKSAITTSSAPPSLQSLSGLHSNEYMNAQIRSCDPSKVAAPAGVAPKLIAEKCACQYRSHPALHAPHRKICALTLPRFPVVALTMQGSWPVSLPCGGAGPRNGDPRGPVRSRPGFPVSGVVAFAAHGREPLTWAPP